jgi:hypothetical protein
VSWRPGGALIVAAVIAALGALTLLGRAGAAISAAPAPAVKAVPADRTTARSTPAGEAQPAPSHGAIDGAGNSAQRPR